MICARAAVTRAMSARLSIFGATSAANNAMIVTTTSISISVTPACLRRRSEFLFVGHELNRNLVDAGNCQQHAQNQSSYDDAHHKDHQRLEHDVKRRMAERVSVS